MVTSFKKTADVVVIGGGCNGTATAMFLARRGVKNGVLVEKSSLTSGATEDSIGNLRPYCANETIARVVQKGIEIFQHFDDIIGGDPKHIQNGRIWAVSEKQKKYLENSVAHHQRWGIKTRLISVAEAAEMMPQVDMSDLAAAAYFDEAGNCDPVATTFAYAKRARDLGVTIYEETEVTGIKVSGGKVRSVVTSRGEIAAPVVVNAAGYYSGRIGKMVGLDIPITPERQQNILLRRPYDFTGVIPCFHDAVFEFGFKPGRPDLERLVMVYATIIRPPDVVDPDNFKDDVDESFRARALEMAYRRFPALKRASYRGGATGIYDESPDDSPILGAAPEVEGFYCHCGWSGLGFMTSPVIGDAMAELITTGTSTFPDLAPYRLSRFKEGKLLPSDWVLID
ncbi:MAG: FAD-binding oxidoreductase [Chloroflexi bacterium]|nr:FAD-binding oxidoreductase [Chloroflexota bacterium]